MNAAGVLTADQQRVLGILSARNPLLAHQLTGIDAAGLDQVAAFTLLANASQLRQLAGDSAADMLLGVATDTLHKPGGSQQ